MKFFYVLCFAFSVLLIKVNGFSSELLKRFSEGINPDFRLLYEGDPQYSSKSLYGLIKTFLDDRPIVLEAGAHEGENTSSFAELWPEGQILAFEPNPRALSLVREVCKDYSNVRPFQLALDLEEGIKNFYLCQGPAKQTEVEGASSLLPSSEYMQYHYQGDVIPVQCVVVDQWCQSNQIPKIDFMWLDLEGKELDVLKGAKNILKTTRVIYTETNFQEFRTNGAQYHELRRFLEEQGFEMIAHWYLDQWQGNALFVKRELLNELQEGLIAK